ncbi:MFS transporter [Variovorax ginsengisoli]|uniref:MFS family arabinose efflux permease n=1 Tax=Variovorax ginsengisoli TaxID=363844 RepID=A0ABT9SF99_9BURK|nr:MFS transporter [Variovorax ginsengisoli]MDP9902463.1 putative MFS family arabinose efflux permease [Variovorax ginsengisoli]
MSKPVGTGGKAVLTIGHMAGMIDLVALPLWVGGLMQYYHFAPEQAGLTVTVFLLGMMASSAVLAPLFNRLPRRQIAAVGYAVAALGFAIIARQPVGVGSLSTMALLHGMAGLGAGSGLSLVHGSMGRTDNPHRLFALVNLAAAVLGIIVFATVPGLIARHGASILFIVLSAVMGVAALFSALAFPDVGGADVPPAAAQIEPTADRVSKLIWVPIVVVMCLTLNQAMIFAFVERIGAARSFTPGQVQMTLVWLGFVNLVPGPLAALLQKRLSPMSVGIVGPLCQGLLALTLSNSTSFLPYALATAVYVSVVIFSHTFLFGLLSRLDPSGRAVSATPAMTMIGSCLGPALAGFVVAGVGYQALGYVACAVAAVAALLMLWLRIHLRGATRENRHLFA